MNNQTAILVFSRNPFEDAEIKCSENLEQHSGNCFEKSLAHIFNVVNYSGFKYFVSTTKEKGEEYFSKLACNLIVQFGEKFGERFYHSIKKVFEKGYENIIVIGNDTPSLKLKDINFAAKHTSKNNSVTGPSKDGGFYLLSLNKNDFIKISKNKFISINFQSSSALAELSSLLNDISVTQYLLKKKSDFDELSSLQIYYLFKVQIENSITGMQNILFNYLIIEYYLTLFIKYKNSFKTFTSLSSPPLHI